MNAAQMLTKVGRRLPAPLKSHIKRVGRRLPAPVKKRIKSRMPWLLKAKPTSGSSKTVSDPLSGDYTNRIGVQDMVNRLARADVISFDVFDTLILRPFLDPKEVFSVLEVELDRPGFRNNRVRAEGEARAAALKASRGESREITLRDIYERLHLIDGLDIEAGIQAELRAERRYVRPNAYMVEVLYSLIAAGKKIAFTSDMYLSAEEIHSLLMAAGIDVDVPIFVSSEYGTSKRHGGLYWVVRQYFESECDFGDGDLDSGAPAADLKFAHVGDNFTTDVERPRQLGWTAHFYKGVHTFAAPAWRNSGQLLRTSAVLGLIDIKFGNVTTASGGRLDHYALGYRYAGPMALAYVDWIAERAREMELDQLVFLSRDGYLLHAIYQMTGAKVPSIYLPWSRSVGLTGGVSEFKSEWIRQFIGRASEAGFETASELLDALSISVDPGTLAEYSGHLQENGASSLERLFQDHWDVILPQLEALAAPIQRAVDKLVRGKHVGIVDIGWAGTGILTLRSMLRGRKVQGFQFGAFRHQRFAALIEAGTIENFAFGAEQNFAVRNVHAKRGMFNNTLLEVLMGAPHSSVVGLASEEGAATVTLGPDHADEHALTRQVIAGALDFVADYLQTFAEGPALRGLSGGTVGALYLELERNALVRAVLEQEFPSKFDGAPALKKGTV